MPQIDAALDAAVYAAYVAEGYVQASEAKDIVKVREAIFESLRGSKVLHPDERAAKAVTRSDMVAAVFPSLPGPEQWDDADDPAFAQAVWKKIDTALWSDLRPNANGPVQRLIAQSMGNGYVLCRTKVSKDSVDASYITDNVECIERDFVRPANDSLEKKLATIRADREMLIFRQPQNGQRWMQGLDKKLKALSSATHDQMLLAIEAAAAAPESDPEDEGDED